MNGSTAQPQKAVSLRLSISLLIAFFVVVIGGVIALLRLSTHASAYHAYRISSSSMNPTLYAGDRIFVDQSYYTSHPLADGDLLAFRHGDTTLVKRISAVSGETIEGRDGVLLRNGVALTEPYVVFSKDNPIPEIETFPARQVPAGEIFVTGDSRDASLDSRASDYGPVYTSDVLGKVTKVYLSPHLSQIGRSF
jgi:signal peptidase I